MATPSQVSVLAVLTQLAKAESTAARVSSKAQRAFDLGLLTPTDVARYNAFSSTLHQIQVAVYNALQHIPVIGARVPAPEPLPRLGGATPAPTQASTAGLGVGPIVYVGIAAAILGLVIYAVIASYALEAVKVQAATLRLTVQNLIDWLLFDALVEARLSAFNTCMSRQGSSSEACQRQASALAPSPRDALPIHETPDSSVTSPLLKIGLVVGGVAILGYGAYLFLKKTSAGKSVSTRLSTVLASV